MSGVFCEVELRWRGVFEKGLSGLGWAHFIIELLFASSEHAAWHYAARADVVKRIRLARVLAWLGVLVILMGTIFLGIGIKEVVSGLASQGWPKVEGEISESGAIDVPQRYGSFRAEIIRYRYVVGGEFFEGKRISFHWAKPPADALARTYWLGRRVEVFYSAGDPSNSVLETGITGGDCVLWVAATMMPGGMGALVVWMAWRARRKGMRELEAIAERYCSENV